jgi:ribosome-associated protein
MSGGPDPFPRVVISETVSIPLAELEFTYDRSSGPGGQNVNKVATRVTLRFDVAASPSLSETQKAKITANLATRINRAGVLRVVASRHRTQAANRKAALDRFTTLLAETLEPQAERVPTRVPRAVKRKRRIDKARRSETKALRRPPKRDD